MLKHSWKPRAVLTAVLAAALMLVGVAAVPGAAQAESRSEMVEQAKNEAGFSVQATLIATHHVDIYYQGLYRGFLYMEVYSDHTKWFVTCDERADGIGPAFHVDPSGSGPPNTVVYGDSSGADGVCAGYEFTYSTRKWRPVVAGNNFTILNPNEPWTLYPLPYNDF